MARTALFGLLLSLAVTLVILSDVSPSIANDQTCDHLISAPGTTSATITISAGGTYCLATNVNMAASFTSGNAIEIAANYVTFDLNGHKVNGAAAGIATQATGIHAQSRRNVTVKNGTVGGFLEGITLVALSPTAPSGFVVEGIRAEFNRLCGIALSGGNSIVRNNVVANTGPTVGNSDALGIAISGVGARVLNNDILTVTGAGTGKGNGIFVDPFADTLVVGNRITRSYRGLITPGKYRDNLTSGATIPFSGGGTDLGNNF